MSVTELSGKLGTDRGGEDVDTSAGKKGSKKAKGPKGEKKGGKLKLIIVALVAIVGTAAGYWFLMGPGAGGGAEAAPKPGQVFPVDAIQVNLADGHFLKIGIAVQAVDGVSELDSSKALDSTITLFSGQSVADLSGSDYREHMKMELAKQLEKDYEGEVMGVYFTDFVMQ